MLPKLRPYTAPVEHADLQGELAILLNANARGVTRRVRRLLEEAAPEAHIFWSRSEEQAEEHIRRLIRRGVTQIVAGGGDGTLVSVASTIRHEVEALRQRLIAAGGSADNVRLPDLGVLKLGTGNAVADVFQCGNPVSDLRTLNGLPSVPVTELDLLNVDGLSAPFCGFGYDAQILNDYLGLKKLAKGPFLSKVFEGVVGYVIAAFTRTLPSVVLRPKRVVYRVVNEGGPVYRVSYEHGIDRLDVPKGGVIYSGYANMMSLGTVPYYGYRLTMFPFARILPRTAHLRVVRASVSEALPNLRGIWQGTWSSPNVDEFLVTNISIQLSEKMPFQIGGDAKGSRKHVNVSVHPEPFRVFDMGALANAEAAALLR